MTTFRTYEEASRVDPQGPLPFGYTGVGMRAFWFKADQAVLQKMCDYYLNTIAAGNGLLEHWDPFGVVIVTLATYERAYIEKHPDMGYMTQAELVISVPVIKMSPHEVPLDLAVFTPYCFVDNDWSMVGGREMLGYPKLLGWFDLPGSDPADSLRDLRGLKVKAHVMPEFSESTPLQKKPIFFTEEKPSPEPSPYSEDREQLRKLWPFGPIELYEETGVIRGPEALPSLVRKYAGASLVNVGIKQLRDPHSVMAACYQGLTTSALDAVRFVGAGPLPLAPIYLPEYASLNIAKACGLTENPYEAIEPFWAQWYYGDFVTSDSRNIVQRLYPAWGTAPHTDEFDDIAGIYRKAIDESFEQWRAGAEKMLQLRYGPGDYLADLMAAYQRTVRVATQVGGRFGMGFPPQGPGPAHDPSPVQPALLPALR